MYIPGSSSGNGYPFCTNGFRTGPTFSERCETCGADIRRWLRGLADHIVAISDERGRKAIHFGLTQSLRNQNSRHWHTAGLIGVSATTGHKRIKEWIEEGIIKVHDVVFFTPAHSPQHTHA